MTSSQASRDFVCELLTLDTSVSRQARRACAAGTSPASRRNQVASSSRRAASASVRPGAASANSSARSVNSRCTCARARRTLRLGSTREVPSRVASSGVAASAVVRRTLGTLTCSPALSLE